MNQQTFDVGVVGGGMVGLAVALGLAKQGKSVAIIEPHTPQPFDAEQGPDLRVSAISQWSQDFLASLGAWQGIAAMRVKPFSALSVWEKPGFETRFSATDIGASQLGHIIENRLVQLGLMDALQAFDIKWLQASVESITPQSMNQLQLSDGSTLAARLVVGADGAQSKVRKLSGIGTQGWQYQQQALGINIRTQQPSIDETWQQFFPSGPRAYLPLYDHFASLVWYDTPEHIATLKKLSPQRLKAAVLDAFDPRLGDEFEVLGCASFPLTRMHALRYSSGTQVLVGDAAHTINPLAGQGVNLGFKDVDALLACLSDVPDYADEAAVRQALARYERKRRTDNLLMMSAMDVFNTVFSNDLPLLAGLRNLALKGANHTGVLKHQVMRFAMGMR